MEYVTIFDIMILLIAIALIVLGLIIWIKQNISLTLDYSANQIKEEDIKAFTKLYGITYITMGIFMIILTAVVIALEGNYRLVMIVVYLVAYFIFMNVIKRIRKRFAGGNIL